MAVEYKASSEVSRRALVQAGLTAGQSAVYEALIHFGPQKATKIAFLAGVPRTLSYKVLDELEQLELVSKKDKGGKVAVFTPAHPHKLKERLDKRVQEAKTANMALDKLILDFNDMAGSTPQAQLYAKIAMYSGKASLDTLSASDALDLKLALKELLSQLEP